MPSGEGVAEYTVAELAEITGVPARTIRFYQSAGVLPKPEHRGRGAVYDDEHRERLRLIAELQDRGLSLGAIRDLLSRRASPGVSVGAWLGLDDTLRGPWSEDRPRIVDEAELNATLGDRPPGFRSRLERTGYLERQPGSESWLVPSPALLELALQLQDAGIDVEISGQARDLLQRRVSRAVDDLIALFVENVGSGFAGRASSDELATALAALRPIARESAGVILAHEIERGLRTLLEGGPAAVNKSKSARRRRSRSDDEASE
jgi:DNA-binding transcriptional MerR regulator